MNAEATPTSTTMNMTPRQESRRSRSRPSAAIFTHDFKSGAELTEVVEKAIKRLKLVGEAPGSSSTTTGRTLNQEQTIKQAGLKTERS